MSTIHLSTPARALIESAAGSAQGSKDRLVYVFSFVPDHKLKFKPSSDAKSALEIMAHVAVCNRPFAEILRGKINGSTSMEVFERYRNEEASLTTRADVLAALEESHAPLMSALRDLADDAVSAYVETPGLSRPMTFFMNLPSLHYIAHTGQIEYLQTIWGDLDFHVRG